MLSSGRGRKKKRRISGWRQEVLKKKNEGRKEMHDIFTKRRKENEEKNPR